MKIKATTKAYVRDILTRTIFRQQETLDKFLFKTNWSEQVHSQQLQRGQDFRRQGAVREPQADPGVHPGEEHHGDVLLQPAGHRSGGRQALSQADSRHHHVRGQQQLQHWDHGNVKRGGTYEENFNKFDFFHFISSGAHSTCTRSFRSGSLTGWPPSETFLSSSAAIQRSWPSMNCTSEPSPF